MRRTLALGFAGAVLLLPTAAAPAAITPQRGMAGVSLGMTKAQVQARLGPPTRGAGFFYYPSLKVGFRNGRVVEVTTTRRAHRTASGIGIDSSEADVRRAYPSVVCTPWSVFRRCRLGSGKPGTRVTDFTIGNRGRVLQVTVALLP
jgi:hypothetical protein